MLSPAVTKLPEPRVDTLPTYLVAREYPGLNGLRGISILSVLLSHLFHENANLLTSTLSGEWGVLMFFVISGFLITTLLTKERLATGTIALRSFYLRRALRIFPVAYLYILTVALFGALGIASFSWNGLVGAALYIRNLPYFDASGWLFGHYWSLSVEEQYYLFVPLLLIVFGVRAFIACFAVITAVALVLTYLAYHNAPGLLTLSSLLFFQVPLAVGSCTALLICHGKLRIPRFGFGVTIGFLAASAMLYAKWVTLVPDVLKPLICSIPLALVVVSSIQHSSGAVYIMLNNRVIVRLGVLSYSLYIWQQAFLGRPVFAFSESFFISASVNMLLLGLVATCSYYFFERPFLRIKDRIRGSGAGDRRATSLSVEA